MLRFQDRTAAIDEPRTARMEQRTKPSVKAQIQLAAALLGIDETTFVSSAALAQARRTIADHERTLLSAADREVILAALETPAAPTAALRQALALHRTGAA
jgi:uncharacterized protein (DUF1778 family)